MSDSIQRRRIFIRGAVQGVGFRPTVYRIATDLKLNGYVNNSSQGVTIEVEGEPDRVQLFLKRLATEKPPRAVIQGMETTELDPAGYTKFEVQESVDVGIKTALILPDIATCPDCLRDVFDPKNRRHLYPFTNCTNCGPRFTIVEALPYDRDKTTMKVFPMCDNCRTEYEDPSNRRFHAQPNACPACGPHIELWKPDGTAIFKHHDALLQASQAIRDGKIVAVKGLGGFHLVVDARNDGAIRRLRERKHREEKPLALMMPTLASVKEVCHVSEIEERLLTSPESPIVLLQKTREAFAKSVAPRNPALGVMLPYTPLHHLLMRELGFPIVATSGNRTDEPICTDEREALERLGGIADAFLIHNRPIARYVDDSIVRVMAGREMVLRRARGYAPLPVVRQKRDVPLLAVGAHLKNTIAFSAGGNVFLSHHIGDLETPQALQGFQWVASRLPELYDVKPAAVACDLHPDYASSEYARSLGVRVVPVQHHHAHVLACIADNDLDGPVLGVAWDGTGLGTDRTIWGGEFLLVNGAKFERVAHLRTFPLPGGDAAAREAARSALGVLFELYGVTIFDRPDILEHLSFPSTEVNTLRSMLQASVNTPRTSSAGRLFDAVAALTGVRNFRSFEGQAAMELEFAIGKTSTDEAYEFRFADGIFDYQPMIDRILTNVETHTPVPLISARFHNTLVEMIVRVAKNAGENKVLLTGGCFQNRYLAERSVRRLREEGFSPYWHQRVPPNDGGTALGQILAAWYTLAAEK